MNSVHGSATCLPAANRGFLSNANPHSLAIWLFLAILLLGPGLFSLFSGGELEEAYHMVFVALLTGLIGSAFAAPIWKGDRSWFWLMGAYRKSFQRNVGTAIACSCFLVPFIVLYGLCYGIALVWIWSTEKRCETILPRKQVRVDQPFAYLGFHGSRNGEPEMSKRDENEALACRNLLVSDKMLEAELKRFPFSQIQKLRTAMYGRLEGVEERLNPNYPYLAVRCPEANRDICYLYFQRKSICMDLRLPQVRQSATEQQGFAVRPRANWQAKANWLTGIRIPYDCIPATRVAALIEEAYALRFEKL